MKTTLLCFIFLFPSLAVMAQTPALKSGDILLQPLACWACSLIEAEEGGPYSHSAVVIEREDGIHVLEAFGSVHEITLSEFLAKTERRQSVLWLRPQKLISVGMLNRKLRERADKLLGLPFDNEYIWDNRDEHEQEMFYCSEFVYKLLLNLVQLPSPKPMHFLQYREHWENYYQGNVPDGELGLSPMDFAREPTMIEMGSWQGNVWTLN